MVKLLVLTLFVAGAAATNQEREFAKWSWQSGVCPELTFDIRQKFGVTDFKAIFTIEGPLEAKNRNDRYGGYEVRQKTVYVPADESREVTVPSDFLNYQATYGTYSWRYSVHGRVVLTGKFNHKELPDGTQVITIYPTKVVDKANR